MISRSWIFFLLLFATVALPWGIVIYKAEEQLLAIEPASENQEVYFKDRAGEEYASPAEYIASVEENGGDVTKAKIDATNPIPEWETKGDARSKEYKGFRLALRNVEGAPLFPRFEGGSALRGKRIYEANGCVQCHTQQVRRKDFGNDAAREVGQRPSVARDYIFDSPALLGRMRIGPDLSDVGSRIDETSLHKHIFRPHLTSAMPAYPHFYKTRKIRGDQSAQALPFEVGEYGAPEEGYEVIPKASAKDLVSYLSSLRQDHQFHNAKYFTPKQSDAEDSKDSGETGVLARGKELYNTQGACVTCHQANGQGLLTAKFPPLVNSEWVTGSEEVVTRIVLNGMQGPLKIGDVEYGAVPMVPTIWKDWPDEDIAAVISYIRNEWGNQAPEVSADTVKRIRAEVGTRGPWTAEELEAYKK